MSETLALASPLGVAARAADPALPARAVLAAFLVQARASPRSPWHTYAAGLPAAYDTPLWWSPGELSALAGTALERAAPDRAAEARGWYDAARAALVGTDPVAYPPDVYTW